jgi:hypothetical protein
MRASLYHRVRIEASSLLRGFRSSAFLDIFQLRCQMEVAGESMLASGKHFYWYELVKCSAKRIPSKSGTLLGWNIFHQVYLHPLTLQFRNQNRPF